MEPTRTCVGCRERAESSSLVRVIVRDAALEVDLNATAGRRGSWVHPTKQCVDTALTRKVFGRALKAEVTNTEALTRFLSE
jgi:predicted RNA-binding protein YlxR (DUF448 family)